MPTLENSRYHAFIGDHEQYPWKPMPWKGIFNKVLFCDPVLGTTIELAKIEKGAFFPVHYHPTVQTLFLLTGRIKADDRVITPGTFDVIPSGERHGGYLAEEDSVQLKFFSAVPVYFLENGDVLYYCNDGAVRKVEEGSLSAQNIMRSG